MTISTTYLQPAQTVGIVYWGRSGTILLHSLLDSHPDVLSCNAYFWMYSFQMDQFLASEKNGTRERLLEYICDTFPYLFEHWPTFYPEMFRGKDRDLRFGTDREKFRAGFRTYLSHFPDGTPFRSLPAGFTFHSFVLQAIHVAYAIAQGQPLNSNNPTIIWQAHFWQADYFRERFPDIRVLSAVRHPLRSYDAWQVRAFVDERVPPFWFYHSVRLRQMLEFTKVPIDLANRCRAIRFEDIHNRTESVMRSLATWLKIRWDDCLLESTFDGEPYWGVKGGCSKLLKPGEIAPVSAVVTGLKSFDESQLKLKYLGLVDRLRMETLCESAYEYWQYEKSVRSPWIRRLLNNSLSLLLLLPSRLDRKCYFEDLKLESAQLPRWALLRKLQIVAKSVISFLKNKFRFCREMLDIKRNQSSWEPITPIYVLNSAVASKSQDNVTLPTRRAA